eukprot:1045925-Ditylum_brightwellii.AAC.1
MGASFNPAAPIEDFLHRSVMDKNLLWQLAYIMIRARSGTAEPWQGKLMHGCRSTSQQGTMNCASSKLQQDRQDIQEIMP